jgi:hypothetical protein
MYSRAAPILLLSALCLAAPLQVRAEVYKWVDEQGVVNYGDKPPQRAKGALPLSLAAGSLSVVPGIPKEELERMRESVDQMRLQRLERELDELRARDGARAAAPVAEPSYTEVYGYPLYGYGRHGHRRPDTGLPHRPKQPIAQPRPPGRAPLPGPAPYALFTR